jgi:acetyltransferase-like isoleucine patch superfamily enzyme
MPEHQLTPIPLFDCDAVPGLREQILRYHMSGVLTDVERARLLGLPNTCRIREGAKIICPEKLLIGEYVWIGEGAVLDASGGLRIGSHTSIGLSVFVWTHTSHKINRRMDNRQSHEDIERKPTSIGEGCFVAGPSVILPGVTIGDRVLIGPLSVVDHDLESGEIFVPQRQTAREMARLQRRVEQLEEALRKLQQPPSDGKGS